MSTDLSRFYEIVPRHKWNDVICPEINNVVDYLRKNHGVEIEAVGLENYRAPETVIILNKNISLREVRENIKLSDDVSIDEGTWFLGCDKHFVSISFPRYPAVSK